ADAALKQAQTGAEEAQAGVQQAEAGVNQAQAAVQQAEAGLGEAPARQLQTEAAAPQAPVALKMGQSHVPALQAQPGDARFHLAQSRRTAPADGYVVDWQVQEGTMITAVRASACGTFIVTAETFIAASFPQNFLMHVQPGDDVDVVLDPYPGRLFKAKVDAVI